MEQHWGGAGYVNGTAVCFANVLQLSALIRVATAVATLPREAATQPRAAAYVVCIKSEGGSA
ncbi:hypothetical protein GCM10010981_23380 [Dyella nitratireducens]|uniref:Uncharacterized protein n=1 Tax=Dyella nitratireducens TaxID=1849580 RepID=A0ABQ1G0R1_9GAMM|nr:hypothetical protein GCM10010981_23380 [Dyella nitratireducens]GLQ40772.1 hypothetical protein GCM10007902_06220 [Dyella nitratireducens]